MSLRKKFIQVVTLIFRASIDLNSGLKLIHYQINYVNIFELETKIEYNMVMHQRVGG